MPFATRNADAQLGKIISKLKELGQYDDTLIVVTADHGEQGGKKGFYGTDELDAASAKHPCVRWMVCGHVVVLQAYRANVPNTTTAQTALQAAHGHRQCGIQLPVHRHRDLAQGPDRDNQVEAAEVMATLPGVIATYVKSEDNDRYLLQCAGPAPVNISEFVWWIAARAGAGRHDGVRRLRPTWSACSRTASATLPMATTVARRSRCSASR